MTNRILIVDDEESIRYTFSEFLTDACYRVDTAENFDQAVAKLEGGEYDTVFLDIMLGRANGIDVLKVAMQENPNCPVIMVTGGPDVKTAAEAVRYGAFDYITKPVSYEDLLLHAKRGVGVKKTRDENERYQKRLLAVFEGIGDGILVFDSDFILIDMNYAATEILKLGKDYIGKSLSEILKETGNAILLALREPVEERVEGELYRLELGRANDKKRCIGACLSPLTTSTGQENDFVLTLRDETLETKEISVGG